MRSRLLFLLKYYVFWILLSVVARVIFLLYEGEDSLTGFDYGQIFYRGLQMDISLGGYIMLLACVILMFSPFIADRIMRRIFLGVTGCVATVFWFIVVADLELFENWGYHMDATPLMYIKTPKEALASTSDGLIILLSVLWIILSAISFWIYREWIGNGLSYKTGKGIYTLVFSVIGGIMIVPIRGGFDVAPMNSSFVFFHKTNMYANQAAINPVWNFMYEVQHMNSVKKKYHFMPDEEAHQIVDSIYRSGGDYPRLLKTERPNIVVLLLESFSADAIEVLGGEKGVTPSVNQLAKEGILFTHIYATGNRSDRGVTGVIGALPSYPNFSLMKYPNKTAAHPRFSNSLEEIGYHTRFYYAGDINFGGFRSFITMSFQDMVTQDDFSGVAKKNSFKWGIHDEYMFNRLYEDVNKAPQPFLYMAFNMSSHEPYEVPMETKITGDAPARKFMNAIYYADRCIGEFVAKAKDSGLWDNMLMVLVADHGTIRLKNRQPFEPETYHIPVIFAGGALHVRDSVVTTIGSQTDIVATLLAQLGIDHAAYRYSKNLLAEDTTPFAYYAYTNAVGMVTPAGVSILDLKSRQWIRGDSLTGNRRLLQAYLQVLDQDVN